MRTMAARRSRKSSLAENLQDARSLQDIFELVKEAVWKALKADQAGLMVGLAELGIRPDGFLGAYYSPEANTIVMNRTAIDRMKRLAGRELYNSYCFYILLHEYLHSCGFYDENENRQLVAAIALGSFGQKHPVAKLATRPEALASILSKAYLGTDECMQGRGESSEIEFVEGIDRRNTNYIS